MGPGGQASLCTAGMRPGVGRAGLTQDHSLRGAPSWLTQGTFPLTLHTGVSSEARGTGAGPLHGVAGGCIRTLTLLGAVFPEEATGASCGGGREGSLPNLALPSHPRLGPRGLLTHLHHPKGPCCFMCSPKRQFRRTCHVAGLSPRPRGASALFGNSFWSRQPASQKACVTGRVETRALEGGGRVRQQRSTEAAGWRGRRGPDLGRGGGCGRSTQGLAGHAEECRLST